MAEPIEKKVLIVELNEFNIDLLISAIQKHNLPTLAQIVNLSRSTYKIQDRYNSGYLEPWVQWVSVHTGVSASKHQIKHLGDVPDLTFEQFWETLSRHNIKCGIWGVMNGTKRAAANVPFFLPDPWTFTEKATPEKLNALLALPRYLAKNYQNLNKFKVAGKALQLVKFLLGTGQTKEILKEAFALRHTLKKYKDKHFAYIAFFDYLSTLLFIEYKKQYRTDCSVLFLNSLAHCQHHHWHHGPTGVTPELLFTLQYLDKAFAKLLTAFPDDALIVHNGLTQINTNHEKPWVLYRQKDPAKFLKALGLPFKHIEQHMTHDGHVFFATADACEQAYQLLKGASLLDKPLFIVEKNANDATKLFYQLQFTDELNDNQITFIYNNKAFVFFEHFDRIVTRTGRHLPMGNIFSSILSFPNHINNYDFNAYLFNYFLPELFPLEPQHFSALHVGELEETA